MADLSWYSIRKYFRFDEQEIRAFIILSTGFAFILSFQQWGVDSFDFGLGLKNYVVSLIIVAASLMVHDSAHRLAAIKTGFVAKLKVWWLGAAVMLILCIISNGAVKLFLGASTWFAAVPKRRLGKTESITAPKHHAYLALAGPVASLVFAGIIRALADWIPLNPISVNNLVYFNLVFGILSFLPIPPLDGSKFFFYSRVPYVFLLGVMICYGLLHLMGIPSFLIAVLGGLAMMIFYMYKVEGQVSF